MLSAKFVSILSDKLSNNESSLIASCSCPLRMPSNSLSIFRPVKTLDKSLAPINAAVNCPSNPGLRLLILNFPRAEVKALTLMLACRNSPFSFELTDKAETRPSRSPALTAAASISPFSSGRTFRRSKTFFSESASYCVRLISCCKPATFKSLSVSLKDPACVSLSSICCARLGLTFKSRSFSFKFATADISGSSESRLDSSVMIPSSRSIPPKAISNKFASARLLASLFCKSTCKMSQLSPIPERTPFNLATSDTATLSLSRTVKSVSSWPKGGPSPFMNTGWPSLVHSHLSCVPTSSAVNFCASRAILEVASIIES